MAPGAIDSRATAESDMATTIARARTARFAVPILIAVAFALRIFTYLRNPAMSNDEASLALNLMHRSYGDVFGRLDFNQAAPPGFLVLQKLVIDAFGASPYSLRLIPLLASLAACLLFYSIVARVACRWAALAALALFAISGPLVSYAATNKQYSIDVAIVLALYTITLWSWNQPGGQRAILLASAGVIAAFASHAAVFVLAAVCALAGAAFAWPLLRGLRVSPAEASPAPGPHR